MDSRGGITVMVIAIAAGYIINLAGIAAIVYCLWHFVISHFISIQII